MGQNSSRLQEPTEPSGTFPKMLLVEERFLSNGSFHFFPVHVTLFGLSSILFFYVVSEDRNVCDSEFGFTQQVLSKYRLSRM